MLLEDFVDTVLTPAHDFEKGHLFGERSGFACFIQHLSKNTLGVSNVPILGLKRESTVFNRLRGEKEFNFNEELLDFWEHLVDSLRLITHKRKEYFDQACAAFGKAVASIDFLHRYAYHFAPYSSALTPDRPDQYGHEALFQEIGAKDTTSGFWVCRNFIASSLEQVASDEEHSQITRSAFTPILFNKVGKNEGMVLWLTIELYEGVPGPFTPDVRTLGLTNVAGLVQPLQEVWDISGLSSRYRGVWRLTTCCPSSKYDYDSNNYPDMLEGSSVQAAALAAIWAANGQIPRRIMVDNKPTIEWFTLNANQKPFRLHPMVAISSALNIEYAKKLGENIDDSIPLAPILKESAVPKVDAMARYCSSKKASDSLFDTAIICTEEQDQVELRKRYPKAQEQKHDFKGITILDNCVNIGDALNWMLEVNIWKHAYNEHCREEWESSWGDARNEHGHWLNKETGKYAEDTPIERRINTGTIDFMKNEWAQVAGAQDTGQEDMKPDEPKDIPVDPNQAGS